MVNISLAQIFYKPAIVERSVDYLQEPGLAESDTSTVSLLEKLPQDKGERLKELQKTIRSEYITYISQKLYQICKQAHKIHPADLLVFPEYSVPYSCLPVLQELARKYKMTIVAGSHTVLPAAEPYYVQSHLNVDVTKYSGYSIAPVFFPDGKADYQTKHDRSIFEITMQESTESFKKFCSITREGVEYSFYVLICADSLYTENMSKIDLARKNQSDKNLMVVIEAYSTNTEGFESVGEFFSLREVPVLVCNNGRYGGSGIYLSKSVRQRFSNPPGQSTWLESKMEAIMFLDFLPDSFAVKRGVLDTAVRGSWAVCPLLYGKEPPWEKDYKITLREIKKCLQEGECGDAADYAEVLLTLREGHLPDTLQKAFAYFQNHVENFCGDILFYTLPLQCVLLPFHSTYAQFRGEIKNALELCVNFGQEAIPFIVGLMQQKETYPEETLIPIEPILPEAVKGRIPTQAETLEFRDRGNYMNQLQEAMTNSSVHLILISGAYGIGKSSLVAVDFKRNLPNWSVQTIGLTPTTRFSMVLEYIANAIGHSLKADTLTNSGKNALKPILERFTRELLLKDGRAIVVDQMESILMGLQGKDHTLLTLFRDAIYNLNAGRGKIIFISDVRFSPEIFPDNPAVKRIVVGRISDNGYVKKILEYEMRRHELISPGDTPDIPERVYELVNGHPLTAKLCVEAMARQGVESLNDISLNQVQEQVIQQLLQKIHLGNLEKELLCLLSVFRTLIEIPRLKRYLSEEHKKLLEQNIEKVYISSFISAGDNSLEVTSAFRSYYYEQISEENRKVFHEYALNYYVDLHKELAAHRQFSSMVYAEIAYHLTRLNRIGQLKQYLPGNVNTLKQLARSLYQRDKNYSMSLQIYQVLYHANQKDVEVLSYLGRCYARTEKWDLVKKYFQAAIDTAEEKKEDTWYLYRDWGHMYVRYYMEAEAEEKFSEARKRLYQETGMEDDAGILAAEAFLEERKGNILKAIEIYETALTYNHYHEFTIHNYADLLRRQGKEQDADKLEERLVNGAYDNLGEPTDSLFSGFDIVDIGQETDDE